MCHACTMCAIRVQAMCTRGSCACTLRVRLPVQRVCNMCAQCLCIWVNSHTARVASLRVPGVQHTCARCSACVCMPVPVCEACARALCPTRGRAGLRHWLMQSVRGRHPPPPPRARPCEAVRGARGRARRGWATRVGAMPGGVHVRGVRCLRMVCSRAVVPRVSAARVPPACARSHVCGGAYVCCAGPAHAWRDVCVCFAVCAAAPLCCGTHGSADPPPCVPPCLPHIPQPRGCAGSINNGGALGRARGGLNY